MLSIKSILNKLSTKPLGYQKTTSYKKKGTPKPRFADKPSPLEKIRSMIGSMSPFAKGGTVPQGYPNDTFPAMLTSGEIVIPQAKLEQLIKVSNQTEKLDTVKKSVSNKTNILNNKTNPLYKNDLINNIYKSSSDVVNTFNSTKEDLTKKTNVSNNVTNKGNTINNKSEKELIKSFSNVKNLKQNQNWISDAMTSQKNISYFNEISKSNTNIKNIPKMVTGGTVPQGYLNDNYPALLTSGETVIPAPGKLNQNMLNRTPIEFEDVRFVIEENQLVGILKKANVRKSIY